MQQALYPKIYLLCRVIHAVDPQAGYLGEVDGLLQVKLAEGLPEAGAAYRAGFVFLEGAVPKEQLCAIGAGDAQVSQCRIWLLGTLRPLGQLDGQRRNGGLGPGAAGNGNHQGACIHGLHRAGAGGLILSQGKFQGHLVAWGNSGVAGFEAEG